MSALIDILSEREINDILDIFAGVHRNLREVQGLFEMDIAGEKFALPIEGYKWRPIPGISGTEICPIPPEHWPVPPGEDTDYFATRSKAGTRSPKPILLPMQVRVTLLKGVVDYWKESEPLFVRYFKGQTFSIEAGERYQFEVIEDTLSRVAFRPRLTYDTRQPWRNPPTT